jgi:hypothetical protein
MYCSWYSLISSGDGSSTRGHWIGLRQRETHRETEAERQRQRVSETETWPGSDRPTTMRIGVRKAIGRKYLPQKSRRGTPVRRE